MIHPVNGWNYHSRFEETCETLAKTVPEGRAGQPVQEMRAECGVKKGSTTVGGRSWTVPHGVFRCKRRALRGRGGCFGRSIC